MKFSEQWLREWVNPEINTQELVHQITMAGLEVDGVEQVAAEFQGVVVGLVESVERHPDADKLSVCRVSDGSEQFQVVCGAPNVREGLKVPFAKIGAELPGNFKIKKAKLRGVESCGMLCADSELGMAESSDGLMELNADAPVGVDFRDYLKLNDRIIEVDLTPNRSDCLSIAGLAREVSVLNQMHLSTPEIAPVEAQLQESFDIDVKAPAACPRYIGRIIRNVNVSAESPLWLQEKLRRCGVRSIDPVVDVTNYVMLELGQPMHAFDLNLLEGGIVVRMAEQGEKLVLLDGQEVELNSDTLVIADHKKALAMAGIMGGEGSGVNENTKDILLESAYFDPLAIAGRARSYGLHTDSSHRFERGVDYQLQRRAVDRATALLLEIVGGQPAEIQEIASKADLPRKDLVELRHDKVERLLGTRIKKQEVEEILTRLGLQIEKLTKDGWKVCVPSYRFDISIEVDLVEEIGRVYGYNNLPVTNPVGSLALRESPERVTAVEVIADQLIATGYQEVVTYSFVDPVVQGRLTPQKESIPLANPISSDMSHMRTSLWAGLLKTLSYNQKRQQPRMKLFETGLSFERVAGEIVQTDKLAGLLCGQREVENWCNSKGPYDFFDAKSDLEVLFRKLGGGFEFIKGENPALHPGQCAEIRKNDKTVGFLGALHPSVQKSLDLNGPVYLFELCLDEIVEGKLPKFKEFSKFPEVRRDLAIIVNTDVQYATVESLIAENAGELLTGIRLFDVYQGDNIGSGKKSLAIGITWQHPTRTLNDEEITETFDQVIKVLSDRLDATLRS
ncbi:phenylalanyl-tRNA synthetase subunit beta [Oleiphilus messinensis]|uniref:Phenylalanine--tRNA ligase beta subunit n=1 Tax=Oleiphilus messinensis TaxID=141451 RepID=A0A1Y0IFV6_9GAMM|nr:phenylalanine--tRNA ligase subunit beta [Oleiphilus messinensis]ARU58264.1 phenylalanyl-tRNA synthetase subunit beta [Oleiphilus messinensis]